MSNKGIELIMKKTSDFGTRLETLCRDRGIPINELARRISVSSTTVHEWIGKSGRLPRNPDHLKKLSDFFNVSLEFLLFGEEQNSSLEAFLQKSEIHTGLYEITIKKVSQKNGDKK